MDKKLRNRTIFNPPQSKQARQNLRKNLTEPERLLWLRLRHKQLGVKFRRQHGIGPYIGDFYCAERALVIELDGESHFTDEASQYDERREGFMKDVGIRTLRFTNREVVENMEGVMLRIIEVLTPP